MRAAMFLVLAGCFGAGPDPGTPSKAKVLFTLPLHPLKQDNCTSGQYIGNVAIGPSFGYVVTHAFLPSCNGGGGNPMEQIPSDVWEFDTHGGNPVRLDGAGMTQEGGGSKPRIGANADDAIWFYGEAEGPGVHVRSKSGRVIGDFTMTASTPAGMIVDETKTYLGTWSNPAGPTNIMSPRFPCCGTINNNQQMYDFVQLTNANPVVKSAVGPAPHFTPAQVKASVVANSTNLIYFDGADGPIKVRGIPKAGGTAFDIDMLSAGGAPGGLAADDTHVVWANTVDFVTTTNRNHCEIFVANATPPFEPVKLISTDKWSCTDVAIDASTVYFPIVEIFDGESDPVLVNRGIGRIDLATKDFGSMELGIAGPELGPRAVFVDGDGLLVVAPFAIARIAKDELNGKREISD